MVQQWYRRRIQRRRENAASLIIQQAVRQAQAMRAAAKRFGAICAIQAWFRGIMVRRASSKAVKAARQRVEDAKKNWKPENTVHNRATSALELLLRSKQLTVVSTACRMLEGCTRWMPVCCERAVEHRAVPVILALMQSCNRSVPHLELVKYGLSVLKV